MTNPNTRRDDPAAILRRQVAGQRSRSQNGQFAREQQEEDAAAPVGIVELIRSTLEGLAAGPVTEQVPVTSTPVPALNDITGLIRGALTGAYTVNGQRPR